MEKQEFLLNQIKLNSSNMDYYLGDALMATFPIDFIKESSYFTDGFDLCCEPDETLRTEIVNAINQVKVWEEDKVLIPMKVCDKNNFGTICFLPQNNSIQELAHTCSNYNVWETICTHYVFDSMSK